MSVSSLLGRHGCEVVALLVGAAAVKPVDPFGGGELEVVEALRRSPRLDECGLVEPNHRLS